MISKIEYFDIFEIHHCILILTYSLSFMNLYYSDREIAGPDIGLFLFQFGREEEWFLWKPLGNAFVKIPLREL